MLGRSVILTILFLGRLNLDAVKDNFIKNVPDLEIEPVNPER